MENGKKPTPTQARILKVLSDGQPHKKEELMVLLSDELSSPAALAQMIATIRKILPRSQDIVCVARQNTHMYRHVRTLVSMDD